MGVLTIVRHGQASFLADDYDKLSPLGELQARKLGAHWLRSGVRFEAVFYGPRRRQIHTGQIAGQLYRQEGLDWPERGVLEELDEYPAEAVMRTFLPVLSERYEHLRSWTRTFHEATDFEQKRKAFDAVLDDVTRRWIGGEVHSSDIESWEDFCARVRRGLERILRECAAAGHVVVFTSAGPTAAAVRMASGISPLATLELAWRAHNSAFAEFLFDQGRMRLCSYDNKPHLDSPEFLTLR